MILTIATESTSTPSAGNELSVLLKILGTLAGGFSVLSFVVLVGGVTTFARLSAAGLPADEGVSDVPKSELLVLGAKSLVPFALAVLVAAAFLYVLERPGRRVIDPDTLIRQRLIVTVAVALGGVGLHVLLTITTHAHPPAWTYALVVAASALFGALVLLAVGGLSFQWFLVGGTIAAALLGETSVLVRTFTRPTVRPVAVARNDAGPVAGIFVAQTSSQVLVGEVCTSASDHNQGNGNSGFMQLIPRSSITSMLIGTNSTLPSAVKREATLLAGLPGHAAALPPDMASVGSHVNCTDRAAAMLAHLHLPAAEISHLLATGQGPQRATKQP